MRLGIFAATFDPPHLGHLDIVHQAKSVCDHLILAIAINPDKTALFSIEERKAMLQKMAPEAEVLSHKGLLLDLVKEKRASYLIRALRFASDFDYEFQMAQTHRQFGIKTLFFMAEGSLSHISSTLIRDIAKFQGPLNGLVPKEIEPMIRKKFGDSGRSFDLPKN